jgi:dolichol-phosphate mannosyltransferase
LFGIVVLWNAQHDWASFAFQTGRTANQQRLALIDVPMFWLFQALALTPAGLLLLGWAVGRSIRRGCAGDMAWLWVAAFALPLFLMFFWASTKTHVHLNWTAPAFLSIVPGAAAVAAELMDRVLTKPARRWRWILGGAATVALVALVLSPAILLGVGPRIFSYQHAGGWRALAERVEQAEQTLRAEVGAEPFILGADKYNLAAELSFYTREPAEQVNVYALGKPGLGFAYWTELTEWQGRPAVVVLPKLKPSLLAGLARHFARVGEPQHIAVPRGPGTVRSAYLVPCYDYTPPLLVEAERGP